MLFELIYSHLIWALKLVLVVFEIAVVEQRLVLLNGLNLELVIDTKAFSWSAKLLEVTTAASLEEPVLALPS